jgi:indoleamine 2,3-dioxygenase
MKNLVSCMKKINAVMEDMWSKSEPRDYLKFRTFIMGIKDQTEMFPNGVIYEGVDPKPRFYRGESGANDSIIPTCDNLLQLTWKMPQNPMTEILRDFRSYRPKNHNEWLEWVDQSAKDVGIEEFCMQDAQSLFLYVELLDQVRDFRNRHWMFAKEYIIKHTAYPKATGGSPMATCMYCLI